MESLSIHDNLLISYEGQCEAQTIMLRTAYRVENEPTQFTNVVFKGVQGYHFENDAFGNVISVLEPIPLDQFLTENGAEISESYRPAGSPGPWAANLGTVVGYLREQGVQGFILYSSFGLSGWVLARELSILSAQQGIQADHP